MSIKYQSVMAGLVPAISLRGSLYCHPKRDHRVTALTRRPGDDKAELGAIVLH
jgi:hypothetical protein